MRDDFYSAAWTDKRGQLTAAIGRFAHKLGADVFTAFESLNRQNYREPWRAPRGGTARQH